MSARLYNVLRTSDPLALMSSPTNSWKEATVALSGWFSLYLFGNGCAPVLQRVLRNKYQHLYRFMLRGDTGFHTLTMSTIFSVFSFFHAGCLQGICSLVYKGCVTYKIMIHFPTLFILIFTPQLTTSMISYRNSLFRRFLFICYIQDVRKDVQRVLRTTDALPVNHSTSYYSIVMAWNTLVYVLMPVLQAIIQAEVQISADV